MKPANHTYQDRLIRVIRMIRRQLFPQSLGALWLLFAACHKPEKEAVKAVTPTSSTPSQAPIGVAKMEEDGTLVLTLRADGPNGLRGEGHLEYHPRDRDYQDILKHLGPIEKGQTVSVKPWPDSK